MKTKLFLLLFFPLFSFAQNDITFTINHLLDGKVNFSTTDLGKNNLSTKFTLNRFQYYLSDISIMHDGGQTLSFEDTTILIDAFTNTNIALGNFDVTNLERVTFHLGVAQTKNHLDPSLYPSSHPLAPKSPSMHWGWTSGYRFFTIEGLSSGQIFELHGFGDALYEEIVVDFNETVAENGTLVIDINAEYNQALKDLDVASGFEVHDDENDPRVVIGTNNFKNNIFTANEGEDSPSAISNLAQKNEFVNIFPNPTSGIINIDNKLVKQVKIYNSIGKLIKEGNVINGKIQIDLKGIYFINLLGGSNQLISINKIIVY